jgi:hypothetical protein
VGNWGLSSTGLEERIDKVAYKLKLLAGSKIHNVFHVGLLKKFTGAPPLQPATRSSTRHGQVCLEPEEASKCRVARGHEILIKWKGQPAAADDWVVILQRHAIRFQIR